MKIIKRFWAEVITIILLMLIVIIGMLILAQSAEAAERFYYHKVTSDTVRLGWNANTEPDMKEYIVYAVYDTTVKRLAFIQHPDTTADIKIDSLSSYYVKMRFACSAADSAGWESGLSDTVSCYLSQERTLYGDIDRSARVDIMDLMQVNLARGSQPGHYRWGENKDLNGDGRIDIVDKALLMRNLGAM